MSSLELATPAILLLLHKFGVFSVWAEVEATPQLQPSSSISSCSVFSTVDAWQSSSPSSSPSSCIFPGVLVRAECGFLERWLRALLAPAQCLLAAGLVTIGWGSLEGTGWDTMTCEFDEGLGVLISGRSDDLWAGDVDSILAFSFLGCLFSCCSSLQLLLLFLGVDELGRFDADNSFSFLMLSFNISITSSSSFSLPLFRFASLVLASAMSLLFSSSQRFFCKENASKWW